MRKILLSTMAFVLSLSMNAQDEFEHDGLKYQILSEAEDGSEEYISCMGYADGATAVDSLVIPGSLFLFPTDPEFKSIVTTIGSEAFASDNTLLSVELPETVKTIDFKAFKECKNLAAINLENIVKIDFKDVFSTCQSLTELDLSSATTINNYGLYNCTSLESVDLSNIEVLGDGVFRRTGLTQVVFPSTLNTVGEQLFRQCESLKHIKIEWTEADDIVEVTELYKDITDVSAITVYVQSEALISEYVAKGWGGVDADGINAEIVTFKVGEIPANHIGDEFTINAIDYIVTDLTKVHVTGGTLNPVVTIPATVTRAAEDNDSNVYDVVAVASGAFQNNTSITSVNLASSVKDLYKDAFSAATNLESINLENVENFIGQNVFYNCSKLTSVDLSSAISLAGNFSFLCNAGEVSTLTSVKLGGNVETLGRALFNGIKIESINIPESVTSIGTKTFMDNNNLTEVQVNWTTAEAIPVIDVTYEAVAATDDTAAIAANATFLNVDTQSVTLYVPAGTKADYEAVDGWKDFNIVEGILPLSFDDIVSGNLEINVTADAVTVNSSSTFVNGELAIYDITGRLLVNTVLNSASASVSISNLASGIYIVKVSENGAELVKRIIK